MSADVTKPVTKPARRGECPVCGHDVALRKDGAVMPHNNAWTGNTCTAWTDSLRPRPLPGGAS